MSSAARLQPYIGYAELFGGPPDESRIVESLGRLSVHDCLQTLGKLSHLRSAGRVREADLQLADLLPEGPRSLAALAIASGRPFLFQQRILAAARLALLHADTRSPDSFDGQSDVSVFSEAVVAVTDLLDRHDELAEMTEDEQVQWFLSFYLRRVGTPSRATQLVITRFTRIFLDLPARRPELVPAGPPASLFETATGIGLRRYLAICLGIYHRYANWNGAPDSWLLWPGYWANTTVTNAEYLQTARTVGATLDELRNAFAEDIALGHTSLDDARPLKVQPLCEVKPETFLTIDVETLADALLGDGLFWRLKPDTAAPTQAKSDFGESVGHLVEAHCVEVARSVYQVPKGFVERAFVERRYTGVGGHARDSVDLAVFDSQVVTFIEIGANRPHFRDTIARGDLSSFQRDIEKIVLPRAEQLNWKIDDFRSGALSYPGHEAAASFRVIPVLCLLDGFPLGPYLYDRILKEIASAGLLQQEHVEPLAIVSVEELELLFGRVEAGSTLSAALDGHRASGLREWPLREYLVELSGGQPLVPSALAADFQRLLEELRVELFG